MNRLKFLSSIACILWAVVAVTIAQEQPGDPNPVEPLPDCANCLWSNELLREKTVYTQSCVDYQAGTPYMFYKGRCTRWECSNNKYAYEWSGWDVQNCQAENGTDDSDQCPNGSCKLVPGSHGPMSLTGWSGNREDPITTDQAALFNRIVMSSNANQ